MAFSSPEPEPDFVKISHFSFDKNAPDIKVSENEFSSHLQSEAPVILGDTNSIVPGRLLGKTKAYREANASQYVLDTVQYGYKLIFLDNVPPPPSFLPNNKSALSQETFLYDELLHS